MKNDNNKKSGILKDVEIKELKVKVAFLQYLLESMDLQNHCLQVICIDNGFPLPELPLPEREKIADNIIIQAETCLN